MTYDLINIDLLILLHLLRELLLVVLLVHAGRGQAEGGREDEVVQVVGGHDRPARLQLAHLRPHVALQRGEVDYYGAPELGLAVALHVEARGGHALLRWLAHPPPICLYSPIKHHHIPSL